MTDKLWPDGNLFFSSDLTKTLKKLISCNQNINNQKINNIKNNNINNKNINNQKINNIKINNRCPQWEPAESFPESPSWTAESSSSAASSIPKSFQTEKSTIHTRTLGLQLRPCPYQGKVLVILRLGSVLLNLYKAWDEKSSRKAHHKLF